MRTFIAIDILPQASILNFFQNLQQELSDSKINWVNPKIFHLTLAFLGEIEEPNSSLIKENLKKIAGQQSAFEIEVNGFGYFGSIQQPKVLWVGIIPNDKLSGLQSKISVELKQLGIQIEERQFHPHITLGRAKSNVDVQKLKTLVSEYSCFKFQNSYVKEIIFYESMLRPQGPIYKPIETFSLLD
ncbi:MAG TPA: RNA 2',3'-cyclic phosphodiesterase [Salinivirgaceae bacterium]|nr:RNA 2',3'-cyclic phosphodiesterase [Salinivirgaceae bacterium]